VVKIYFEFIIVNLNIDFFFKLFKLTHNIDLVELHIELSLIEALQNVLQNQTYYNNGTITEAGLELLIGLCPGGCSGNGQCVISEI
jgi:hypothetical protein